MAKKGRRLKTDTKIYEQGPECLKRQMILHVFIQTCSQINFDIKDTSIRTDNDIINSYIFIKESDYPVIIKIMNLIGVVYENVLYTSSDAFDILTYWMLIISTRDFIIDDIFKQYDITGLKKIFSLSRKKRSLS